MVRGLPTLALRVRISESAVLLFVLVENGCQGNGICHGCDMSMYLRSWRSTGEAFPRERTVNC